MATKTWAGRTNTMAWSASSRGWGARGRRQIGFSGSGVRVNGLLVETGDPVILEYYKYSAVFNNRNVSIYSSTCHIFVGDA